VTWFSVDQETFEFVDKIGAETWPGGSFRYNWMGTRVYGSKNDYVGFVATATIYAEGGNYSFELYDVDNEGHVAVDGRGIIDTLSTKNVTVFLSEGQHTLTVTYKEYCCGASIGFRTTDKLFDVPTNEKVLGLFSIEELLWGAVAGVMIGIAGAIVYRRLRRNAPPDNKPRTEKT
jgi:hypothetical protein